MNKKELKIRQIIDDSIQVMRLRGYNGTSVKDLTDAAGIPKGSFYNYFDGKEHYAVAACEYFFEMGADRFTIAEAKGETPLGVIRCFFEESVSRMTPEVRGMGCLIGNLSEEVGGVIPAVAEKAAELHERFAVWFLKHLMAAGDAGEISGSYDLRDMADFLVNVWQGTILRAKVSDDPRHFRVMMRMIDGVLLK